MGLLAPPDFGNEDDFMSDDNEEAEDPAHPAEAEAEESVSTRTVLAAIDALSGRVEDRFTALLGRVEDMVDRVEDMVGRVEDFFATFDRCISALEARLPPPP